MGACKYPENETSIVLTEASGSLALIDTINRGFFYTEKKKNLRRFPLSSENHSHRARTFLCGPQDMPLQQDPEIQLVSVEGFEGIPFVVREHLVFQPGPKEKLRHPVDL